MAGDTTARSSSSRSPRAVAVSSAGVYHFMLILVGLLSVGCARSHDLGPEAEPRVDATVMRDARTAVPDAGHDAYIPPTPDSGPPCIPEIELCDGLDQDCDAIVDEASDALCMFPHAAGACVDGACRMTSCEEGFGDCDGDEDNGCEVDLATSRASCGGCGVECRVSEACAAGACEREEIVDLAHNYHTGCVVLASGRLVCWGQNMHGTIRYGSTEDELVPIEVDGIDRVGVCAVTAGAVCVGTTDAWVLCRGVGEGFMAPGWRSITRRTDFVDLRAGMDHFCGLERSGRVICWGRHSPFGSLGLGSGGPRAPWTATTPLGLPPALVIAADRLSGCAVDAAGVTRCWGTLSIRDDEPVAEQVPFEVPEERAALWLSHSTSHGCFITAEGELRCWGQDRWGGLGVGSDLYHGDPVTVPGIGAAAQVLVNASVTAAQTRSGRVHWWGLLPDEHGVDRSRTTPQYVPGLDGAVRTVIGDKIICAQVGPYSVRCMGNNEHGGLGDGTRDARSEPVAVVGFE